MSGLRRPRVSLTSLGCKVNQYEMRETAAELLRRGFEVVPFGTFYLNSIIIAGTATIGNVLCAALAGYGFARFRWRGRDACFLVLLSTLVLLGILMNVSEHAG